MDRETACMLESLEATIAKGVAVSPLMAMNMFQSADGKKAAYWLTIRQPGIKIDDKQFSNMTPILHKLGFNCQVVFEYLCDRGILQFSQPEKRQWVYGLFEGAERKRMMFKYSL